MRTRSMNGCNSKVTTEAGEKGQLRKRRGDLEADLHSCKDQESGGSRIKPKLEGWWGLELGAICW